MEQATPLHEKLLSAAIEIANLRQDKNGSLGSIKIATTALREDAEEIACEEIHFYPDVYGVYIAVLSDRSGHEIKNEDDLVIALHNEITVLDNVSKKPNEVAIRRAISFCLELSDHLQRNRNDRM